MNRLSLFGKTTALTFITAAVGMACFSSTASAQRLHGGYGGYGGRGRGWCAPAHYGSRSGVSFNISVPLFYPSYSDCRPAPVYCAPVYRAPVYCAPVYREPVYCPPPPVIYVPQQQVVYVDAPRTVYVDRPVRETVYIDRPVIRETVYIDRPNPANIPTDSVPQQRVAPAAVPVPLPLSAPAPPPAVTTPPSAPAPNSLAPAEPAPSTIGAQRITRVVDTKAITLTPRTTALARVPAPIVKTAPAVKPITVASSQSTGRLPDPPAPRR